MNWCAPKRRMRSAASSLRHLLDAHVPNLDWPELRANPEHAAVCLCLARPLHHAVALVLDGRALRHDLELVPLAFLHALERLGNDVELQPAQEKVVVAAGSRQELELDLDVALERLRRFDDDITVHLRIDDKLTFHDFEASFVGFGF